MVDWNDPEVLATCYLFADRINLYMMGLHSWFLVTTLHKVEVPLLTRKLRWRWSYTYYLCARYLLLVGQIVAVIPTRFPAQTLIMRTIAVTGGLVVLCSSGNLLLRTMAIWKGHRPMTMALILLGAGHLVTLIAVTGSPEKHKDAAGVPEGLTRNALPFFAYSVVLDFTVMMLTIFGLLRFKTAQPSSLWRTLYQQGVLYFLGTFLVNFPPTILTSISYSPCLTDAFVSPCATFATMSSCMAFHSLLELNHQSPKHSQQTTEGKADGEESTIFTTVQLSAPPDSSAPQAGISQGLDAALVV